MEVRIERKTEVTTTTTVKAQARLDFDTMVVGIKLFSDIISEAVEKGQNVNDLMGCKVIFSPYIEEGTVALRMGDKFVATVNVE